MLEFRIPSMTCGHCVGVVTRTAQAVDPAARVDVSLPSHRVRIETQVPRQSMRDALAEAGYLPD